MKRFEVIYLTGPPAAGKTRLITRLGKQFSNLKIFSYSQLLAQHIKSHRNQLVSQKGLRKKSERLVTVDDIATVDTLLVKAVTRARKSSHVIVDSHPVTKEDYGFRVTAFSVQLLRDLKPTRVCMLFASAKAVMKRIKAAPDGRPKISQFEADFHCNTQAAVAVSYGVLAGVPVYFYDSSVNVDSAFDAISGRIHLSGRR